jgi:hypothetical protein
MGIVQVIGGTYGDILDTIFLRSSPQFFQMTIKTLDFGKEFHVKGILVEQTDRVFWVHCGKQPIAGIPNGAQMAGGDVTADADHSKVFWHVYFPSVFLIS